MGRSVVVVDKTGTRPKSASTRLTDSTARGGAAGRPKCASSWGSAEGSEPPGTTTAAFTRAAKSSLRM